MLTGPNIKRIAPLIMLSIAIIACNLPQTVSTPDLAGVVAQTQTAIAVNQFLSSTSLGPTLQATNLPQITMEATLTTSIATPQTLLTVTPVPSNTQTVNSATTNCRNAAKFITETVLDNSEYLPGQQFIKTWTIQNVGTCTWNPEYALVYVRGEKMGGTTPSPIGQSVIPGAAIQIYLPQTAPMTEGVFQGFWMLRSSVGQDFGIGQSADTAFWVKIRVSTDAKSTGGEFSNPQNLGNSNWKEAFDDKSNPWYLGTDSNIDYSIKDGKLVIIALKPIGDQWRVAQSGYLEDFYLQARFTTGAACSGKDGYGLVVRAPEKSNGIINSGLIFSFSCDGKYRVYRLDNSNYTGIQNWVNSPAIKSGSGQTNDLGIYANGSDFQLYSNGVMIYEFTDTTYSGGLFGLVIRSESTHNFQVLVDEIAAWDVP